MGLLNNSNAIESGGYNIDRSLRFRSSASAYLSKVLGTATNTNIWTWSGWVKRGKLGSQAGVFGAGNGTNASALLFESGDTVSFYDYVSPSFSFKLTTTQVFRDPSAWYHFTLVFDSTQSTASNRVKLYVNGIQVTSFSAATYPTQNTNCYINRSIYAHTLAQEAGYSNYLDGYLSEVNFIDGQALTPSSFGETSTETGVWVPKKYTGTYGTNGFYLDFKDNTSATTLAYDKSGNGNNWTANNISTTAGATYDSMTDVPTLTSATAANYAVLNPLKEIISGHYYGLSYGNLRYTHTTVGADIPAYGTFSASTGKWYFEAYLAATGYVANRAKVGITTIDGDTTSSIGNTPTSYAYLITGNKVNNSSSVAYGSSYAIGDLIGVALDLDAGTLTFYKNNVSQGVAYSGLSGNFTFGVCDFNGCQWDVNFGQRPFSYTPPTGFKALNTFNLPDPTIKKPNQYMDATLYTGTGSNLSVVNAGAFQPSLVWAKARSTTTNNNFYDAVRGTGKILVSNNTDAEVDVGSLGLSAFNSNGFSLGTGSTLNDSGQTYVGWQWKESATAGFDIVTYTGNSTNRTIAHNLGVAPKMIIVKARTDTGRDWCVYHSSIGATGAVFLNLTSATATNSVYWNDTSPTSSVFSLGTAGNTNSATSTFVAYLFAEIPGFSKFGSYTGNGSTDGPFVYCGFRPKYVMIKRTDSSDSWVVQDSVRGAYNEVGNPLYPNLSNAENSGSSLIDILSNGVKPRGISANINANGGTYIFAAFAETPTKFSLAR